MALSAPNPESSHSYHQYEEGWIEYVEIPRSQDTPELRVMFQDIGKTVLTVVDHLEAPMPATPLDLNIEIDVYELDAKAAEWYDAIQLGDELDRDANSRDNPAVATRAMY